MNEHDTLRKRYKPRSASAIVTKLDIKISKRHQLRLD